MSASVPPATAVRLRRPRPTRRTYLVRRLTALGVLLVLVLLLVALVQALFGDGDEASAPLPAVRGAAGPAIPGVPAVPERRTTVLDRLVAADRVLAPGAEGAAARGLQQALTVLGLSPGPIDGVYSDGTRAAVAAFQEAEGLTPSGSVDAATADALREGLVLWAAERTESIREGLVAAEGRGDLSEEALGRNGAIAMEAALQLARMPADRAAALSAVLTDVATQAPVYDRPRAAALFGMVEVNARHLAAKPLPEPGSDVLGADGTVYRHHAGHGLQFHPLANFARLNRYLAKEHLPRARTLAAALRARAVPAEDGLVWEYYFPFGGPGRWTSALAQAAGAQAFTRTALALDDDAAARAAKGAFDAIPETLARPLAGGTWVREYSFSDMAVLNAQLQSLVSLTEYATGLDDDRALAFTRELSAASREMLPELDTGSWSDYAIGGSEASQHYHCYHVDLLRRLIESDAANASTWTEYRTRWQQYADARGGCPD